MDDKEIKKQINSKEKIIKGSEKIKINKKEKIKKKKVLKTKVKNGNKKVRKFNFHMPKFRLPRFNKKYLKRYILITISVVLLVILSIFLYNYLENKKYDPYYVYEDKVETYGFSKLYNNGSSNTTDEITISEALKMAVCATFNIDKMWIEEEEEYLNQNFVDYAIEQAITNFDINIDNKDDKVKYIDVISYFGFCKENLLKNTDVKSLDFEIKDIGSYNVEQQKYINDLVSNDIVEVFGNNINGNDYIFKGQLNALIVNFVEKLDLLCMEGERLNINPDKLPENYDDYPYIVNNIEKEVYEYPTVEKSTDDTPQTAAELYATKKDSYLQIKEVSTEFLEKLLNIDYNTIEKDDFKQTLNSFLTFEEEDTDIEKYINYVKENEIVTKGEVIPLLPIFYFDGISYKLRVKVNYEIVSSKTRKNLMYYDNVFDFNEITYNDDTYEFYIDYPLKEVLENTNFFFGQEVLYNTIIEKDKVNIIMTSLLDDTEEDKESKEGNLEEGSGENADFE